MKRAHYLILSAVIVILDAFTKWLVNERIALHDAIPVIPNLFQIVHVRNTGAAFGIGANAESQIVPLMLNVGAIAVFIMVVIYALRTAVTDRLLQTGLHLILGGAIGNLVDRFRFGYVVDFLDVYITLGGRERHWPAFNVADSAICIGIALLFLDMRRKPEETATAETAA
ncbi:MAG TPA: signal peptidase II [Thermoanaerobaculia bacterium]|nr:signal peptidase II [Thermoanaerobaculia bacterium]